jgi:hypothetical protein
VDTAPCTIVRFTRTDCGSLVDTTPCTIVLSHVVIVARWWTLPPVGTVVRFTRTDCGSLVVNRHGSVVGMDTWTPPTDMTVGSGNARCSVTCCVWVGLATRVVEPACAGVLLLYFAQWT